MVTSTPATAEADDLRLNPAGRRRTSRRQPRVRAVLALLLVSGVLFVAVVCWHRDRVLVKAAMDAAEQVRAWTEAYQAERGHLPFDLPTSVAPAFAFPEIPYPHRNDIYRLNTLPGPFVLIAGPRQGLLPPEPAGCAAVIWDHGNLRTEWMRVPRVEEERKRRDELLAREAE